MNLARFVRERRPAWAELDALLADAKRRPERLGPDGVLRLGELYRATAADFARARSAFPGDPLVRALEHRLVRARHLVYDAPTRRDSLVDFVKRGYWQEVRRRPLPLLMAVVLLFAPAALAGTWAYRDPGSAAALAPGAYRSVTEPRKGTDLGLAPSEKAALSSQIFTNNIRVTLLTFAGGIALGVGAALLLVYNGMLLGVVGGLAVQAGNGRPFFELVTAHGVLELSCIAVAGAAGMRFGWAIVEPGRRTRAAALGREGRRAVAMVLGTAPWLVVAGLVEGFVTPSGFGLVVVAAVGFTLAAVYWSLVLFAARRAPATSP